MEALISEQWVHGRVEYLHGSEEYHLAVSSGFDTETYVVSHAGMVARRARSKLRPGHL